MKRMDGIGCLKKNCIDERHLNGVVLMKVILYLNYRRIDYS